MKLLTKCPQCKTVIQLSAADADKRLRCRQCNRLYKVPQLSALKESLAVLESAAAHVYVDEAGKIYG